MLTSIWYLSISEIYFGDHFSQVFRSFEEEGLKFENIGPQDVYDKNYTLIMGMMWRVVRKYHINGIDEKGKKQALSERDEEDKAKTALLDWTNRRLAMAGESTA